jgi:cell division protein ZapA
MATKDTKANKGVTINILGRELRVAAPDGEERTMLASVDLLNRKIKEIRDTGKVVGNERIAILAALNLAHEHLTAGAATGSSGSTEKKTATPHSSAPAIDEAFVRGKMNAFEAMIEKAISEQEKLF